MRKGEMNRPGDLNREELLRAFKSTPPAFEAGVDRTLRRLTSEKEEPIVKRKLAFAPALVLALALLTSVAFAAALYPKTIDRIRSFYGADFAGQLETYGESVELNQSTVVGDVKYTITDAVWSGGVLYGTIVMEPVEGANILLIAEDMEVTGPVGYNPGYGEVAPEGTKSFAETAEETGATIVLAKCIPDGLVVGGAVRGDDVGVAEYVTPENTILSTFELYGAQKAESYTVRLYTSNWQMTNDGEWLREEPNNTWLREDWDVTVTPIANEANAQSEGPVAEAQTAEGFEAVAADIAPSVYALAARNFMETVDPEWFNQTGIAEKVDKSDRGVTFADGKRLSVGPESVFYYGYDGTEIFTDYGGNANEVPADDLAGRLYDLACSVHFAERYDGREPEASRDAIPAMTLSDAKATLDALLAKMGIENVQLVWSYGMDLEHINMLNDERTADIQARNGLGSSPAYDMSGVTEDDGGWLLMCRTSMDGMTTDDALLDVNAFVNKNGVSYLRLRQNYTVGDVIETPETLLTAEQALTKAIEAAGKSWIPEMAGYLKNAIGAEMIYAPHTAGELRLVPTWRISAADGEKGGYVFTVDISAVDGALLDAPWM